MSNNVSYEYAEALFLLSCEENDAEGYLSDLMIIKEAIEENGEYISLLSSPNITKEEKLSLVDAAFGESVRGHVVSFLKLLCERGRAELLPECLENYEKLYNQVKRVIVAEVTSAVELTPDEREKLVRRLEKKTGHKVELVCHVDEGILGGIIVKTEDTVMDGSLKRKIRDVKDVIKVESKT